MCVCACVCVYFCVYVCVLVCVLYLLVCEVTVCACLTLSVRLKWFTVVQVIQAVFHRVFPESAGLIYGW